MKVFHDFGLYVNGLVKSGSVYEELNFIFQSKELKKKIVVYSKLKLVFIKIKVIQIMSETETKYNKSSGFEICLSNSKAQNL